MSNPILIDFSRRYWALINEFPADLCGYSRFEEFFVEGIEPCLSLATEIPAESTLLDIGSGGGLPGLVFAFLQPLAQVHLLEPRRKRWAFLREAAAALGLKHVTVHLGQWPGYEFPDGLRFDRVSVRGLKLTPAMITALRPRLAAAAEFLLFHDDNRQRVEAAGLRVSAGNSPGGDAL